MVSNCHKVITNQKASGALEILWVVRSQYYIKERGRIAFRSRLGSRPFTVAEDEARVGDRRVDQTQQAHYNIELYIYSTIFMYAYAKFI